jgi:DUF1365 family protein
MHSAIYTGWLRHRRHGPRPHAFRYRLDLLYLDLAELDRLFAPSRWRWLSPFRFRRSDYLGDPNLPLDEAVRARVAEVIGRRPQGAIRLLAQPRCFGFVFNPVSFYYCFDDDAGTQLVAIVADVTNTPWGERHSYVLPVAPDAAQQRKQRFRCAKEFHVSPFMPLALEYDWHFHVPADRAVVHIVDRDHGAAVFDATLTLERRPLTGANLAGVLLRAPIPAFKVMVGIYWQAARLALKGIRFHPHPRQAANGTVATRRNNA